MSQWLPLAISAITPAGMAIAWMCGLFERREGVRERKFEQWNEELLQRERNLEQGRTSYTKGLEDRLEVMESHEEARDAQMRALRIAFELVSSALRLRDPANAALRQAEHLLAVAFPLQIETPADMIEQLRGLEREPSHAKGADA